MDEATLSSGDVPHARPPTVARRRDWRFWVGGLGRVLIALGLLIIAFVVYQLWGTGLKQDRVQNQLSDRFEVLSAPPATLEPEPEITDVRPGDPIGIIEMPTIGVRQYVVSGVSVEDLRTGPGHFPTTPFPGELGNAAIAGHRTTYGQPFANIDRLNPGDEIVVEMLGGGRYVYRVEWSRVVEPTEVDVVMTTEPDIARLTLTTCHPRWSAAQRLIVSGVLDVDASDRAGTQPIRLADDTANAPTIPDTTPDTTPGTTVPASTTVAPAAIADAFDDGWFSDPDAWPQVIAWSLAVLAIALVVSLSGRRLAARRRRAGRRFPAVWRLAAVAVGAVPFVVALYFTFENVSRLLPPNL
jgi:sortase A